MLHLFSIFGLCILAMLTLRHVRKDRAHAWPWGFLDFSISKTILGEQMDLSTWTNHAALDNGANIVEKYTTQTYRGVPRSTMRKVFWVFGVDRNVTSGQPPSVVLQYGGVDTQACWPFRGRRGQVAIQLQNSIYVEVVAVYHVPSDVFPDRTSAPRQVSFWGIKDASDDDEWQVGDAQDVRVGSGYWAILIANMSYDSQSLSAVQYSSAVRDGGRADAPFDKIVVSVENNWGDEELTCLCGVHVYGRRIGF